MLPNSVKREGAYQRGGMIPLATRDLAMASAGERRMWRSQSNTGVGMSIVEVP